MPEPGPPSSATSTRDRRLYRRYRIPLAAALECGEVRHHCAIHDISLGGAALAPGRSDWVGRRVRLHFEDLDHAPGLDAEVLAASGERMHLRFELDEAGEYALTMFLVLHADAGPCVG